MSITYSPYFLVVSSRTVWHGFFSRYTQQNFLNFVFCSINTMFRKGFTGLVPIRIGNRMNVNALRDLWAQAGAGSWPKWCFENAQNCTSRRLNRTQLNHIKWMISGVEMEFTDGYPCPYSSDSFIDLIDNIIPQSQFNILLGSIKII